MGLGDRTIAAAAKLACRISQCHRLDNLLFPARAARGKDDVGYVWGGISRVYEENGRSISKDHYLIDLQFSNPKMEK